MTSVRECAAECKNDPEREKETPPCLPACSHMHYKQHAQSHCCCCCTLSVKQRGHGIKTSSDVWRPRRCRIPQRVGYSEEQRGHCSPSENRPSVHEAVMDTTAIKTKTATTKGQTDNKPFQIFRCLRALVFVKQWFPQLWWAGRGFWRSLHQKRLFQLTVQLR